MINGIDTGQKKWFDYFEEKTFDLELSFLYECDLLM